MSLFSLNSFSLFFFFLKFLFQFICSETLSLRFLVNLVVQLLFLFLHLFLDFFGLCSFFLSQHLLHFQPRIIVVVCGFCQERLNFSVAFALSKSEDCVSFFVSVEDVYFTVEVIKNILKSLDSAVSGSYQRQVVAVNILGAQIAFASQQDLHSFDVASCDS